MVTIVHLAWVTKFGWEREREKDKKDERGIVNRIIFASIAFFPCPDNNNNHNNIRLVIISGRLNLH